MSVPLYPETRRDRPHARIYHHHVDHPAWSTMSLAARVLYVETLAAYRPTKANSFPMGDRRVAERLRIAERTAKAVVQELIDNGWWRQERRGRNIGCRGTRERVISIMRWRTEIDEGDPDAHETAWRKRNQKAAAARG